MNFVINVYYISMGTRFDASLTKELQVNLDMTDSMGPGKLVRHMQNLSYTYDEYLICIGLGPSVSSVICKNPSYSGPSYPSSPVYSSKTLPDQAKRTEGSRFRYALWYNEK